MSGYAVVDVETTGLFPARHDRVTEVAVVQVDRDGTTTDEWCTLVNPERDLGPQHIHGIRAADARRAPTFGEIAGDLTALLAGRVVVAHNLSFDAMFLRSEFGRLGANVPLDGTHGLCTMRLSDSYLDSPGRSLAACCDSAGIGLTNAHSAADDARACAGLLAGFVRATPRPEPWADLLTSVAGLAWPVVAPGCGRTCHRGNGDTTGEHFLARMVDRLPRVAEPVEADDYLALLDRALLDRHLSVSEQDALVDVARELGLSRAVAMDLHRTYLEALADAAWQDGVVTPDERTDLGHVADLLGLAGPDVDFALAVAETASGRTSRWGRFQLRPGSLVVFTGQTTRPRDEWEAGATAAGLVVRGSISKKVDLVIAADPDSMSGKAATARRYGIPIVTEGAFGTLLKGMAGRP